MNVCEDFICFNSYFNEEIYIIDVSQSVEHDHPHSLEFLRKDCENVNGLDFIFFIKFDSIIFAYLILFRIFQKKKCCCNDCKRTV